MEIKILGRSGLHASERKAVKRMEEVLRPAWYGYASLVISDDQGSMEIDTLIITHDRLLLIELKQWNGTIEYSDGCWIQNGKRSQKSPYAIKREHAQRLTTLLNSELQHELGYFITVEASVVLCGTATAENLPPYEQKHVHHIDDFLKVSTEEGYERLTHDNKVANYFKNCGKPRPNTPIQQAIIKKYFEGNPAVKEMRLNLNGYSADDEPWFEHRKSLYREYKAGHNETPNMQALVRRWDMTQLGTEHADQNLWADLVLREARLGRHVREFCPNLREYMLHPITELAREEVSEDVVELYELRRSFTRLDAFLIQEAQSWSIDKRIELVRSLLMPFAELHGLGLGHRDIDPHNLWYANDQKSIIVSGFATAFFPENGTVSDFRKILQSSYLKLPEDVLLNDGELRDPFRQDVFMLASVAYSLCFDGQAIPKEDGIPEWAEPEDDEFEGKLFPWFEKALAWDPSLRFENANDLLSAFNVATKSTAKVFDDAQDIFNSLMSSNFVKNDINPFNIMSLYPVAAGQAMPSGVEKMRYIAEKDGIRLLVKIWPKVGISRDQPGVNRRISQFKNKVQSVIDSNLATPPVVDCGAMSIGGLFIVTEMVDGTPYKDYIAQNLSFDEKQSLAIALIEAVLSFHIHGVAHGDIHPDNLLVNIYDHQNKFSITLLDTLDYGTSTEPYNIEYGSQNPTVTDAFGRDRYAALTLVAELFGDNASSRIQDEIIRARSSSDGVPITLEPLLEVIHNPEPILEVQPVSFTVNDALLIGCEWEQSFPTEPKLIEPNDIGTYFFNCKWDRRPNELRILNCFITGSNSSLQLSIDVINRKIIKQRLRDNLPLSEIISADQKSQVQIERPLAVQKKIPVERESKELIELLFRLDPFLDALVSDVKPNDPLVIDYAEHYKQKTNEERKLSPSEIWRALVDTELDLCESVVIYTEDALESATGHLLYNYYTNFGGDLSLDSDSSYILRFGDDDQIIGELVVEETNLNTISIKPSYASIRYRIKKGTILQVESVRNKSSRDIRTRALDRVMKNNAVIKNLHQYFDPANSIPLEKMLDAPSEKTFRNVYDTDFIQTNDKQLEAFNQLLSYGPVGVLQGPPGTGKTSFIAKFIHYLYQHCGVENILLAGQTHTSVDNVAIKAKELCAELAWDLDIVRIGRECMIDDGMLPSQTTALQRQISHKFHREYDIRINALSKRMAIPKNLIEDITQLHRALNPLLESRHQYETLIKSEQLKGITSESVKEKVQNYEILIRTIEDKINDIIYSRFRGDIEYDFSSELAWEKLCQFIANNHSYNNPAELSRLNKVLDISKEWLDVLKTGEGGFDRFMVQTKQLVCGTLVGVGQRRLGIEHTQFDWVIVDEAGRAQASELMIALQSGKRVLLVGDHKQLPPFYHKSHLKLAAKKLGATESIFHESDFERAFKACNGVTLDTQYRMVEPIGDLVSECFYSKDTGKLHTGAGKKLSPRWYDELNAPWNNAVTWIDSSTNDDIGGEQLQDKGRIINLNEVNILIELLKKLVSDDTAERLNSTITPETPYPIGIITMYRAQKEEIDTAISRSEWIGPIRNMIKVDTVDSYQGQENKIIILSLVRDNARSVQGFLGDTPRINVAISRAQERLIIIGANRMWNQKNNDSALGKVHEFICEQVKENIENYQLVSGSNLLCGEL